MTLVARLDEIIHLAEQVYEEDWLVIEILQAMHLFFIKVLHFVRCYYLIIVKVYHLEPILYAPNCCFIFF